ncbi:alpha/beta fold hydrolase [Asticcacaulis sp. AC402]|uniref:alpha/beta fold hydrolase n=1 Tax=Asticcacaulis sp. AC402 TaxID=1282361 RepID=UPI0003C3FA52|nr:alpha/beta fold hydrolase [Asticcacaulis sp. AC402]ESQ76620.1 hypothetical protein ABAC402_02800 [Asticcacaulis sp. AC402]
MHGWVLGLLGVIVLAAPAQAEVTGTTSDASGKVAYRVYGDHGPRIVLLTGLGDDMEAMAPIARTLEAEFRVILYDRAGYGSTPVVTGPHDAWSAGRQMTAVLDHLDIHDPVLVVGHSLGGTYAYHYAATQPQRVAGVVLIDARPPGFTEACLKQALKSCRIPPFLQALLPGGGRAEARDVQRAEDQAAEARCASVPVLVVVRSTARPDKTGFEGLWGAQQQRLADRCPNAQRVVAPKGGHYVHNDARAWFLDQVRTFARQVEASRP